jgi:hypothetical protein
MAIAASGITQMMGNRRDRFVVARGGVDAPPVSLIAGTREGRIHDAHDYSSAVVRPEQGDPATTL